MSSLGILKFFFAMPWLSKRNGSRWGSMLTLLALVYLTVRKHSQKKQQNLRK